MGNRFNINLNSYVMRAYLDEGFHKRNHSPQQIEVRSIITGDLEFIRDGSLYQTSIINYTEVRSDYDGIVLKEINNYIGQLSLN